MTLLQVQTLDNYENNKVLFFIFITIPTSQSPHFQDICQNSKIPGLFQDICQNSIISGLFSTFWNSRTFPGCPWIPGCCGNPVYQTSHINLILSKVHPCFVGPPRVTSCTANCTVLHRCHLTFSWSVVCDILAKSGATWKVNCLGNVMRMLFQPPSTFRWQALYKWFFISRMDCKSNRTLELVCPYRPQNFC